MTRRECLTLLSDATVTAWPLAASTRRTPDGRQFQIGEAFGLAMPAALSTRTGEVGE
jgi:hypothetical protein